ncbi:transmembrane protein 223 [Apis laboriosa]|uniref:transmembrane protein 223 n=1 Tax=Apis laboriosa TaxID=183418 RepID=UPI001CC69A68|nr:transmembrane protein 223 [Apis laboriosa]
MFYRSVSNSIYDFILLKVIFYGWCICNTLWLLNTYNSKYISTLFENISWTQYLERNGLNIIYFIYFGIIGPAGAILFYIINHRFIKYIILHKGGNNVSIITNHVLKNNYTMTLPINKIKIKFARDKMTHYLPMKIQGTSFYYIIDGKGTFLNKKLFDYTVGKAKNW